MREDTFSLQLDLDKKLHVTWNPEFLAPENGIPRWSVTPVEETGLSNNEVVHPTEENNSLLQRISGKDFQSVNLPLKTITTHGQLHASGQV